MNLILPSHVRQQVEARKGRAPEWKDPSLMPPWVDLNHPEAKRGTQLLRAFDPVLKACFDPRAGYDFAAGKRVHSGCFAIWGLSRTEGRIPILLCENPDGSPQGAPVPWEWWIGQLHEMRDGPLACERAAEANERLRREADRVRDEEVEERLGLTAAGLLRNRCEDPQDVIDAVNRQVGGQKPEPRGRVTYDMRKDNA